MPVVCASHLNVLLDPEAATVEIERGRFARYRGEGRWESYFNSQRGTKTADGPVTTYDVLCRFAPGSFEGNRIEGIISMIDR